EIVAKITDAALGGDETDAPFKAPLANRGGVGPANTKAALEWINLRQIAVDHLVDALHVLGGCKKRGDVVVVVVAIDFAAAQRGQGGVCGEEDLSAGWGINAECRVGVVVVDPAVEGGRSAGHVAVIGDDARID